MRAAFIAACVGLAIGYWGISHFQFSASETVNDRVRWSFNSRWIFVGALVLGAGAMGLTGWNWNRRRRAEELRVEG